MSINILFELQQEVRRLFIAGSKMASGDMRLQRILPQLQKLGESAPIFNRMAQAVSTLLEAEIHDSAIKLLEISALLNSVLYTQGKTDTKEELVIIEGTESKLPTSIPYRKLSPLLEALTHKGQGRLEQIRQGYEERLFQDFRIVPAAVAALDDSYSEIPEFLQEKVIPEYGIEAISVLRQQLDISGGKGDARRLELLHALLPVEGLDILLLATREGGTEVRSAAIQLLGNYPEQEDLILEQADDKKKDIRIAAFFALSALGTKAAIERLFKALHSKDRDIAIEPIRNCMANDLTRAVIRDAENMLEQITLGTNISEGVPQLFANIQSLRGKRVPEVLYFIQKLFSSQGFMIPETENIQELAADLLLELDLPEANQYAVTLHEQFKGKKFIEHSFKAAVKVMSPEEVYERYCDDFRRKRGARLKELVMVLRALTMPWDVDNLKGYRYFREQAHIKWDPRWVQLCVDIDEVELVCRLAREPDQKLRSYLLSKCEQHSDFTQNTTVKALLFLFYMGESSVPEIVMNILMKNQIKRYYYLHHNQRILLSLLPQSCGAGIRELANEVTYTNLKEELLEIADEIENKPEQAEIIGLEQKGQGLTEWIYNKM